MQQIDTFPFLPDLCCIYPFEGLTKKEKKDLK